jgi:hypothetical protein
LTALLVEQSKYLKLVDYAIKQLDIIQAAIRLVEAEGASENTGQRRRGSRCSGE